MTHPQPSNQHKVLLGGESDMLMCDAQSGYNYGAGLVAEMQKQGLTDDEILKIKVWELHDRLLLFNPAGAPHAYLP